MAHPRIKQVIALIIAALLLAIMLLTGILMAIWTFEFTVAFGGTLTTAWTAAVLIPVLLLAAGVFIIWFAGKLLGDDDRNDEKDKRDTPDK